MPGWTAQSGLESVLTRARHQLAQHQPRVAGEGGRNLQRRANQGADKRIHQAASREALIQSNAIPVIDETVPVLPAAPRDVVMVVKHPVRQPVAAHELPDVLHHVQFRTQRIAGMGHAKAVSGNLPCGLEAVGVGITGLVHAISAFSGINSHALGTATRQARPPETGPAFAVSPPA